MSEPIPTASTGNSFSRWPAITTVLLAGFTAGTLDLLAAIVVYALVMQKTTAVQILRSIASGVFGKQAFAGGTEMALYGTVFHYLIAVSWAAAYFLAFPYVSFLRNQKILGGLLYGVLVWLVMNLAVLPLSNVNKSPPQRGSEFIPLS